MPRFTMRTLVLVFSLCTAMIGTPQARPPMSPFSSQQIADTCVAVRHQVWAECDCLNAESNRVFRR